MTKAEYIATCSASSEAVCLHKTLTRLFDVETDVTDILCDNQSCIKLIEKSTFHDKLKHIEVRYHYIWGMVKKGDVNLKYVPTKEQVADVLTKLLARVKVEYFRDMLGVV